MLSIGAGHAPRAPVAKRPASGHEGHRSISGGATQAEIAPSPRSRFESDGIVAARFEALEGAPRPRTKAVARSPLSEGKLSGPNCRAKRLSDVLLGAIALIVLSPLLILAAIAVAIDTPGPIFFRQWRGGYKGERFQILKFRTMTCMEDGVDICQARPGDVRVTRVGRVLRKSSIDELPQLFNVLRGDMSLVGPRPHALIHDAIYSRLIMKYARRHAVRPGITGWAQVNGCRGETRDIAAMEQRIRRDLSYIRHWSFRLDLIIMVKTVSEVLRPRSAY